MNTKLVILQEIINDYKYSLCGDTYNKVVSQVCDTIKKCHNCPFHRGYNYDHLENFNEAINEHKSKQPN